MTKFVKLFSAFLFVLTATLIAGIAVPSVGGITAYAVSSLSELGTVKGVATQYITTYTAGSCSKKSGSVYPGDAYKATFVNNNVVRISYPTARGSKTAYAKVSDVFGYIRAQKVADHYFDVFSNCSEDWYGTVYPGDEVIELEAPSNDATHSLIIYPISGGYKAALACDSDLELPSASASNNSSNNSGSSLNIDALLSYRDAYWSSYNPDFSNYRGQGGDCANYVSQLLYFGSDAFAADDIWYPDSLAWINVDSLFNYLTGRMGARSINYPSASECAPGDVIYTSSSHVMMVTKVENGKVYATGHTNNRYESYQPTIIKVVKTSQL